MLEDPTFTFQPVTGERFAQSFVRPLSPADVLPFALSGIIRRALSSRSLGADPPRKTLFMQTLINFRDFILRGKIADLAVAVIIGAAFTNIVGSLVKDIINPLLAAVIGKADLSALVFSVNGANITYGNFLNAVISFVIIVSVVHFLIVTPLGFLLTKVGVPPLAGTKPCPYCLSNIPGQATRCGFCTQVIDPAEDTDPTTQAEAAK